MKKIFLALTAIAAITSTQVRAFEASPAEISQLLNRVAMADVVQSTQNLINWKVGDYHKLTIKMLFGGGTGTKKATKEDTAQNAIWLVTEIALMGQNQKTEALISRADGKLLKLIVNGEEQSSTDDQKVEIIEQAETTVTVAAGTFDCIYVKANVTAQGQTQVVQLWANPVDVNLDGTLKMVMDSMFGDVTLELQEFGPR